MNCVSIKFIILFSQLSLYFIAEAPLPFPMKIASFVANLVKCDPTQIKHGRVARATLVYTDKCRLYAGVNIGKNPGSLVWLMIDTGSALSWSLIKGEFPGSNYEPSDKSPTVDVKYGYFNEKMKLNIYKEKIKFKDAGSSVVSAEFGFGGILKRHNPSPQAKLDRGILALATVGGKGYDGPMNYILLKEIYDSLPEKMFALWLSDKGPGFISFGRSLANCYDPYYMVTVNTINRDVLGQLPAPFHSWSLRGKIAICFGVQYSFPELPPLKVYNDLIFILDTGSPTITFPDEMGEYIENWVKEKEAKFNLDGKLYKNDTLRYLPIFNIEFDAVGASAVFSLAPRDYVHLEGDKFRPGIHDFGENYILLGVKFFEKFYTEFLLGDDKMDQSVRIAKKSTSCDP